MIKGIMKTGDEIIVVVETNEVKVIVRQVNGMREIKDPGKAKERDPVN